MRESEKDYWLCYHSRFRFDPLAMLRLGNLSLSEPLTPIIPTSKREFYNEMIHINYTLPKQDQ